MMIFPVLQILREQVNEYFFELDLGRPVVLENIAILDVADSADNDLDNSIALTLLNIEEESSLKNFNNSSIMNNEVINKNPKVNLNLYIMFCANRARYRRSLRDISLVIAFFQGKRVFTETNTIYNRNSDIMQEFNHFKLIVDLFTPTFEELNYIWGMQASPKMLPIKTRGYINFKI